VEVRLSGEEAAELQALAWHRGLNRSALVRALILDAIKRDVEREQIIHKLRADVRY
jgi:hypothetical protein